MRKTVFQVFLVAKRGITPTYMKRDLGLAYVLLVETNPFSEIVVTFPDYALRIPLGTFAILLLISCIRYFKPDLINNMDHMRIVGTEPSPVILSQTK